MDDILKIAMAFQRSRLLLTAYELDVFSVLGTYAKSSSEVASTVGTDHRAMDRLMNALYAMNLLTKNKNLFSNTQTSGRFLVKESPDFMSGLMHTVHLWDTWSTMTRAVCQGGAVLKEDFADREQKWLEAFIAAMHWRAVRNAGEIISLIDLSGVSKVLDVGGGSGAYAMAFVKADPNIRATVFDLPGVVPLTQGYIQQAGLSECVQTVAGNYLSDELGKGFDLIFISAVIHSNSPEENRMLLRKAVQALNPGGRVVIQDFIINEDRTGPAWSVLFALNMLVATKGGDTYTESEVRAWLIAVGLSRISRKDTAFGTALVMGTKKV
jgi:precorrin-6B methylase 2